MYTNGRATFDATIHSVVVIMVFFFYIIIRAAKRTLHKRIHKLFYIHKYINEYVVFRYDKVFAYSKHS